jgi:hypothetical protein
MSENGFYGWVVDSDIGEIVDRIQELRGHSQAGLDPQPARAMWILQAFALRRPIEDLLSLEPEAEGGGGFSALDAAAVLALAALTRPVDQAADLAIGQWTAEAAKGQGAGEGEGEEGQEPRSPITDSIVHDVTAQRTVPDVAVFIRVCRRRGSAKLVDKALNAFVMATSGRTSFDKALLYIELREEQCHGDAARLLGLALTEAGKQASAGVTHGSRGRIGILGALRHLSPSEAIVEDWIEQEMAAAKKEPTVVELVANLLAAEPDGGRMLAEHVGWHWKPHRLIDLCENLTRRSGVCFALVRRYAAARTDKDSLAEIIQLWHRSEGLTGTLKDLLDDIVASGEGRGPRSTDFLEDLHQTLQNDKAPQRCRKELRVAGAEHVDGRTGTEVAFLLSLVGGRELRRAAHAVNRRLVDRLLASEIAVEAFVDYVKGLQELPEASGLTFWALRELSDPTGPDHKPEKTAVVLGDIAARFYAEGLADIGFDLLERCLENEQWLDAKDAVAIVTRVRLGAMPQDERWDPLLSATVGRWAETRRRDDVVTALRRESFEKDAEAVIHSVE